MLYHLIQDMAEKLSEFVPAELHETKEALSKNFKAILQSELSNSMVTRTEFEAQYRMLLQNRAQLTLLQGKLEQLEERLSKQTIIEK